MPVHFVKSFGNAIYNTRFSGFVTWESRFINLCRFKVKVLQFCLLSSLEPHLPIYNYVFHHNLPLFSNTSGSLYIHVVLYFKLTLCQNTKCKHFRFYYYCKGTVSRDFLTSVFFMDHLLLGPSFFHGSSSPGPLIFLPNIQCSAQTSYYCNIFCHCYHL
jgi:hypothetical protein